MHQDNTWKNTINPSATHFENFKPNVIGHFEHKMIILNPKTVKVSELVFRVVLLILFKNKVDFLGGCGGSDQ